MRTCFWNSRGVFESPVFRGSQKVFFGKKRKRKPEFKEKEIVNAAWLSEIPNVLSQKFSLKVDRCALLECELLFPISLSLNHLWFPTLPAPSFFLLECYLQLSGFFFFFSPSYHIYIFSSRRLASKCRQKYKLLNFPGIIIVAEHLRPKSDPPPTLPPRLTLFLSLSSSAQTQATSSLAVILPEYSTWSCSLPPCFVWTLLGSGLYSPKKSRFMTFLSNIRRFGNWRPHCYLTIFSAPQFHQLMFYASGSQAVVGNQQHWGTT